MASAGWCRKTGQRYGDSLARLVKESRQNPKELRRAVADCLRARGCEKLHFTQNPGRGVYWLNWSPIGRRVDRHDHDQRPNLTGAAPDSMRSSGFVRSVRSGLGGPARGPGASPEHHHFLAPYRPEVTFDPLSFKVMQVVERPLPPIRNDMGDLCALEKDKIHATQGIPPASLNGLRSGEHPQDTASVKAKQGYAVRRQHCGSLRSGGLRSPS